MRSQNKRRRIIVNPEFVASMDQSDGSEQYDYEDNDQEEE
jgi:hypothetical protein